MLAQMDIQTPAQIDPGYVAPTIDLDSRRVTQEEWLGLVILGAIAIGTLVYVATCDGSSSFSFGWDGVSASCN